MTYKWFTEIGTTDAYPYLRFLDLDREVLCDLERERESEWDLDADRDRDLESVFLDIVACCHSHMYL